MADLVTLQTRRDALAESRASGILSAEYDGRRITYKSDADMARAIADLDAQIAAATPVASRNPSARTLIFRPE